MTLVCPANGCVAVPRCIVLNEHLFSNVIVYIPAVFPQGMYIKSTYDGLHVITGTTEGVSTSVFVFTFVDLCLAAHLLVV